MTTHPDNMTDEELVKLRKDLSDKNWQAVGAFINGMNAEISQIRKEMQERDKVFANQTQLLMNLQRQVQQLTAAGYGSGPTSTGSN